MDNLISLRHAISGQPLLSLAIKIGRITYGLSASTQCANFFLPKQDGNSNCIVPFIFLCQLRRQLRYNFIISYISKDLIANPSYNKVTYSHRRFVYIIVNWRFSRVTESKNFHFPNARPYFPFLTICDKLFIAFQGKFASPIGRT